MRLFLALELPGSALDQLQQLQDRLRQQAGGRFVPRRNLHLTLAFLGQADPEAVLRALADIAPPRQLLSVTELGTFDDQIYAAVQNTAALQTLHSTLTHALTTAGFALDARTFLPHITLCRKYAGKLPQTATPLTLEGGRLVLMRSVLQPEGAVYTILHRF